MTRTHRKRRVTGKTPILCPGMSLITFRLFPFPFPTLAMTSKLRLILALVAAAALPVVTGIEPFSTGIVVGVGVISSGIYAGWNQVKCQVQECCHRGGHWIPHNVTLLEGMNVGSSYSVRWFDKVAFFTSYREIGATCLRATSGSIYCPPGTPLSCSSVESPESAGPQLSWMDRLWEELRSQVYCRKSFSRRHAESVCPPFHEYLTFSAQRKSG